MLLSHADGSQELGELGAFSVAAIAKPPAVQHNANSETALSVNFLATRILTITTCV
jgi:hypothetical protein